MLTFFSAKSETCSCRSSDASETGFYSESTIKALIKAEESKTGGIKTPWMNPYYTPHLAVVNFLKE